MGRGKDFVTTTCINKKLQFRDIIYGRALTCCWIKHLGCRANAIGSPGRTSHGLGCGLTHGVEVVHVLAVDCRVAPGVEDVLAVAVEGEVELKEKREGSYCKS